jgi:hypothetical protein
LRASGKDSSKPQTHTQKQKQRRNRRTIGFMPLEPRVMYDGAAAASAAVAHHHADHHDIANGSGMPGGGSPGSGAPGANGGAPGGAPSANGAPASGAGEWQYHGSSNGHWSGEQGSVGGIAGDKAPGTGPAPTVPSIVSDSSGTPGNSMAPTVGSLTGDQTPITQVVFIDSDVPDIQDLISGVKPGVKVFTIDSGSDGLAEIANILAENNFTNLTAIDIVGHGQSGEFMIGNVDLTDGTLASEAQNLAAIGKVLVPGGDLMLYGCDVAAGSAGQQFIDDLSAATGGANVAASTKDIGTLTSSNATFENWTLDASTGTIDASNPFTQAAMDSYQGLLSNPNLTATGFTTTLTVDADGDGGISPGDTVTSQVTLNNTGTNSALGVAFSETLSGLTELTNVTITPIGVNDSYTMVGNTPETFDAAHGVLANDIDFNGQTLSVDTAKGASNVTGGSVTLNADGSFTFTPTTGFEGTASFQYFVKDSAAGDSDQVATATITVTAPVWYVDSAASAVGADGSFAHPFQTIAQADTAANTTDAATDGGGVNNIIFVENAGAAYSGTTTISLVNGEELLGDGSGLTSVNGNTVGLSGTDPTFNDSTGGNVITLSSNNTVSGINIDDTGSGSGIVDTGNAGTLTMSNISVTTAGSGVGIELVGGGTVTITGTSNTLDSTAGTALEIENTNIGAKGITFQSISDGTTSGSAGDGIILENTGSSGGLTVTGTGSNSSGGVIEHKTGTGGTTSGDGIYLLNTDDVSLNWMQLNDFQSFGIQGSGVVNFNFTNGAVDTTSGFNGSSTSGEGQGSIYFNNLTGTSLFNDDNVADGFVANASIVNNTGTLDLTVTNSDFEDNSSTQGTQGFLAEAGVNAGDTAVINATFLNDTFVNNRARDIQVVSNDLGSFNVDIGDAVSGSGGTFTSDAAASIDIDDNSSAALTSFFNIENVSVTSSNAAISTLPINIFMGSQMAAGSVFEGDLTNSTITGAENQGDDGIAVTGQGAGTGKFDIANNTISKIAANGIEVDSGQGSDTVDVTITGNKINIDNDNAQSAITMSDSPLASDASTLNATITGNTFTLPNDGGEATFDFVLESDSNNSNFTLPGYTGGNHDSSAALAYLESKNTISGGLGGLFVQGLSDTVGGTFNQSGTATPAPPTASGSFSTPSISGTAQEGDTLIAAVAGTNLQWQESFSGSDYVDISGATSSTYTLTESDVGATIRLVETTSYTGGVVDVAATSATSTVTDNLTLTQPTISGTPTVGQILSASTPSSDNSDATLTYQWLRNGSNISGADASTYTLTTADVGDTISVRVTATDPHSGNVSQTSTATAAVAAFTAPTLSSVSIGTLPGNDSVTLSWEATVNPQSAGLIVNPTYTGSVSGSNFTTAAADETVGLDTLSLEGEIFNDANGDGLLDAGDTGISGVSVSVFVEGSTTALESTSTDGSGDYDFTGLAAGDYYVEITSVPATYGNSSPVRDTTPNDYLGSRNYGLAVSGGTIGTNAITIAYDKPEPTGPTTYPGDDTTNTLDIGLTKNPLIGGTGNTVDFYQGNGSIALDSGLTLTDNGINVTGATVTISSGFLTGDTLNFTTQNGISGVQSGNTLTLSGSATAAQYQAALESITYSFSGDPTNAGADKTRTVTWSVSDSNSQTSASGTTSTIDTFVVPVLAAGAGFTTPVMTTSGALAADSDLTVADVNTSGSAPVATVTISNGFDTGDTLSYNGGLAHSFTDGGQITATFDAGTHALTLTGTAGTSAADFQAAFEAVQFNTTNTNSNNGTRTLTWQFNDDAGNNTNTSNSVNTTFNVEFPPTIGNTGNTAEFYQNQASGTLLDGAVTVADPNVAVTSATVTISSGFLSGDTLTFNNGSTTESFGDGSVITASQTGGVLSLTTTTGTSTAADYQTALESVAYSFSGDPTNAGADHSRTVTWSVTDANNQTSVPVPSTTLDTYALPILTAGAAGTSQTETTSSGPVLADNTLSITDYNGPTIHDASVSISSGFITGDTLTIDGTPLGTINDGASGSITYSFSSATHTLTLTGTDTAADYQAALDLVKFNAVSPNNGVRTLTWTVNDQAGGNTNTNATFTTTVKASFGPNITAGATVNFDGGSSTPVTLDSGLTVTDTNSSTLTQATASITTGFVSGDTLEINGTTSGTINDGTNGTITYSFSGSTLTLTGTDTLADYQSALSSVQYVFTPTNGDPTSGGVDTSRTISWQATDPTLPSNTATSTLDLVHEPPTVTAGGTVTFDGGSNTPVTLDSTAVASAVDSAGNLAGATVSISSGFITGDTLTINGTTSGTINDGANGTITYSFSGSTLTLSGTDTAANYQSALELVQYSFTPSNGDPTNGGGDTSRTISWTVTDGSTSNGTSTTATSTLDTVHVAPVVTAGGTATFDGGGTAVTLDGTLAVTDADSAGNLAGATVSISSGFITGDTLTINGTTSGTIVNGGNTISYSFSGSTLTLTGTDTVADYQSALELVQYSFTPSNGDPTNGGGDTARTISWTVTDGSTSNGTSNTDTSTLDAVHVAPVVTAGGTATFTGGSGTAVTLDSTLAVTDADSGDNLAGATVSITSGFITGDTLTINGTTSGTINDGASGTITYSFSGSTLTLSGTDTVEDYRSALQSVQYSFTPSNGDPTNGETDTSRTISWTVTDGSTSNGTSNTSTSALDTTHTPPTVIAGASVTFDGGGSPVTLDSTLTVTDPDSFGNLSSAFVTINSGFVSGDTLNFTNQNGITGSYDAVHGQLTLTGTASIADYQLALESVTYSFTPANGDPTNGGGATSRIIAWTADDGESSATGGSTLTVVHVAPTVTAGGTATYHGGDPAVTLDGTLTTDDGDSNGNLTGATVQITTGFVPGGDLLNFTNQNGITGSYDSVHGILTLSGTSSVANYQTALESITYSYGALRDPTAGGGDTQRTITWTVNDGSTSNGSASDTSTIDVVHTAPTMTAGATAQFELTGPAVTADATLSVNDVDSGGVLFGATVSITSNLDAANDVLHFTNQNGIIGSYDAATGVLTLIGASTIEDYQTALESITFSSTTASTGTRSLSWTVSDGSTSNGTSNTGTSTIDLVVGPLVTAGGTATFNGGSTTPATLDGTLTVSDSAQADLTGASVSISTGFINGDVLNFTNQNGITGSYDAVHGTLTLSGTATVADYQTALDSVTYSFSPSNGDPTNGGGDTARTISWTATDNVATSTAVTSSLTVNHTAPTVTAGATATFELTGPAVPADNTLSLTDVDSNGNLNGATVSITSNLDAADDVLHFTNQNGITGSYDAAAGVLTLTGTATVADYQTALDSITFSSTVSSAGTRTLNWTVSDGSASNGISNTDTSTIDLVVGPQVTAGGTATFNGGSTTPATLDGALTVSDSAQADLTGASVSISTGFINGDVLNFTNQNGITGSYDAVHGVLTLTGTSSVSNYQTALDSITYSFSPSNADPTNGGGDTSRTISWTATDSVATSTAVTSSLTVDHTAPTVTASGLVDFVGGQSIPVTLDPTLTVSDPDSSGNLTGATVSISLGLLNGDTLNFTDQHGITGSYDAVHGILTLTGKSSVSNYQAALDSITYSFSPSNGDPTGGGSHSARTISWTVTDGSTSNGTSNTATSSLETVHVAPTVIGGAIATFDGGGSAVTLDGALTVSDPDSNGNLTSAEVEISGFVSGDELNFTNQNGITGSYDAVHGILTLTGTSSVGNYQTALESVTYSFNPVNGDPTAGGSDTVRLIDWTVSDGNTGNGTSGTASTLDVVHTAPTVTAGATAIYNGGGSPVLLDSTLAASDVDSSGDLTGATVSISSGFLAGDTLTINGATNGFIINVGKGAIAYSFSGSTLTLAGTDTVGDYQAALDLVKYSFSPSSGDPTNGGQDVTRTISWSVSDGSTSNGTSVAKTSTVLEAYPTVVAGGTVQDQAGLFGRSVALDASVGAYDGIDLKSATVSLGSGFQLGDILTADTAGTSIHALYNPLTGVMTLTGTDTPAHYDQVLKSINFTSAQLNDGQVTVSWQITDQDNNVSKVATSHIQVKSALFPVIGNLTNNPILPPQGPHFGFDNFSPTFITYPNDNGGASFGDGQSVIPLHADVTINVADNGAIDFNAPLGLLEASLDGDVVSITATLPNGQPLPDWLHFNAETGKFAGIVPGDVLTGSLPQDGGNTGGNQGGLIPDKLTVEVVATDAKGDIAIIDFTINLKPDNGTHHGWNLPGDLRNLAPIELPHQHAQFLPHHGLPGPLLAAGGGHDHGAGHALPGRAGLSQQLAAHGLHGMHADRMALLESLRHATAGHG